MVVSALVGGRAKAQGAGTTNLSYFCSPQDNGGLCLGWGQSWGPSSWSQKSELAPLISSMMVISTLAGSSARAGGVGSGALCGLGDALGRS